MNDAYSSSISPLIFATKVTGTPVYSATGERIGHIEDIAIGKATGQVAYAVLGAGGFLGAGERRYPVPWRLLTFDPNRHAYVVALGREQLKVAPSYDKSELGDLGDSDERTQAWMEHWGPFI